MYTYLAIERTPGFLKTEIVVQILVREVAAFKRDIIAAILQLNVRLWENWSGTMKSLFLLPMACE